MGGVEGEVYSTQCGGGWGRVWGKGSRCVGSNVGACTCIY